MLDSRDRLIVALDLPGVRDAQQMVERLGDSVSFYKVGYQLAFASGLAFVDELIHVLRGFAPRYELPKPKTSEEVVERAMQSGV